MMQTEANKKGRTFRNVRPSEQTSAAAIIPQSGAPVTPALLTKSGGQTAKVLRLFLDNPTRTLTTDDLRAHDVMSPASRVKNLRAVGYLITTRMVWGIGITGKPHRMAEYHLLNDEPENQEVEA